MRQRPATVHGLSGKLASWCHAVPPEGPGVCPVCRGPRRAGFRTCFACSMTLGGVSRPCRLVVPTSLVRIPSPLYASLRLYKDGPDQGERRRHAVRVAALLARFLYDHRSCIESAAGIAWDCVSAVPSTRRRSRHPLEAATDHVPWLAAQRRTTLTRGPGRLAHSVPAENGFVALPTASGRRVLIVDDLWTTGARAESAASALQGAGAIVVAIVPVARLVDPMFGSGSQTYWQRWSAGAFDFATCGVCSGGRACRCPAPARPAA